MIKPLKPDLIAKITTLENKLERSLKENEKHKIIIEYLETKIEVKK
jgi:hypothetical protein